MKHFALKRHGLLVLTIIGLAACSTPPTRTTTAMDTDTNTTVMSHPTANSKYNEAEEIRGVVQNFLMSSRGQVNGFILDEGTQIDLPAHLSTQLTRAVKTKDEVIVRGYYTNDKVFKAENIRNARTNKVVANLLSPPPQPLNEEMIPGEHSARSSVVAPSAKTWARERRGLKQMTAEGTIKTKIYGSAGEVTGVVLSDGSVVRFAPDVIDQTTSGPEIGDSIKVTGYGTKNSFGQSIEATSVQSKY